MQEKLKEIEMAQNLSRSLDVNSNTKARISIKFVYPKGSAARYPDLKLEVAALVGKKEDPWGQE